MSSAPNINASRVNVLNIVLMLASLAVATLLPFETFLLAYAVLGPLHYLTQIGWLHQHNYFSPRRSDGAIYAGLTVLVVGLTLVGEWTADARLSWLSIDGLAFAFLLALVTTFTADKALRWTGAGLAVIAVVALHGNNTSTIWFGFYLPTIVHVCLFTGAFVAYGALKGRSSSGYLSLAVYAACVAATVLWDPGLLGYAASDYARDAYTTFEQTHVHLVRDLGDIASVPTASTTNPAWQLWPFQDSAQLYSTPTSVQIARLIAFSYTYHYLNWFSKTSIIRWHHVPRARLIAAVVLWLISIALYAWRYSAGIRWLLFLSFLHVLLELPLDHRTFVGIGRELLGRLRGTSRGRTAGQN